MPAEPEVQLSEREHDILSRIVRGHMYDQIADELHITVHTVKYHVRKIYDKTRMCRRGSHRRFLLRF